MPIKSIPSVITTPAELKEQGYKILVAVSVSNPDKFLPNAFIIVTAKQLENTCAYCNRDNRVLVRKEYGRNGSKSAYLIEIIRPELKK